MLTPKYMFKFLPVLAVLVSPHSENGGVDGLSSSAEVVAVTRREVTQHKQSCELTESSLSGLLVSV